MKKMALANGASKGGLSYKENFQQADFCFLTEAQQLILPKFFLMEQMVERLVRRIRRCLIRLQHYQCQGWHTYYEGLSLTVSFMVVRRFHYQTELIEMYILLNK